MVRVKLAHKIILGFLVVVMLCSAYGSAVFYLSADRVSDLLRSPDPSVVVLLTQAKKTAVLVGVLGVILGITICFYLIKQIVTPIAVITRAVEVHLKESEPVRIQIPNKDELGILALYLNELLERSGGLADKADP